jgi:hypothetical protein
VTSPCVECAKHPMGAEDSSSRRSNDFRLLCVYHTHHRSTLQAHTSSTLTYDRLCAVQLLKQPSVCVGACTSMLCL